MDDVYNKVEEFWHNRVTAKYYSGEKLLDAQAEFFAGAMAAMSAQGVPDEQAMPPRWVLTIMTGEEI